MLIQNGKPCDAWYGCAGYEEAKMCAHSCDCPYDEEPQDETLNGVPCGAWDFCDKYEAVEVEE
jgi:hypothetical protein